MVRWCRLGLSGVGARRKAPASVAMILDPQTQGGNEANVEGTHTCILSYTLTWVRHMFFLEYNSASICKRFFRVWVGMLEIEIR